MEHKNGDTHHEGCECIGYPGHHWMCGGMESWHKGKFMLLRCILGMIILLMVFLVGLKVGEFKGSIEGGSFGTFHGHRMMWRGYDDYNYPDQYCYPVPGMMRSATPSTTASPVPSL